MEQNLTSLQETIAHMAQDLRDLSDELYQQQKDMAALRTEIEHLRQKIKTAGTDSGILRPEEDSPPPHY